MDIAQLVECLSSIVLQKLGMEIQAYDPSSGGMQWWKGESCKLCS